MNEQLQQALADILNKTMAGVEAGASFLQAELPDVIQQLLMWKAAEAGLYFSIILIAAAFGALALKRSVPVILGYMRAESMYYRNTGELEKQGIQMMREFGSRMPYALCGLCYGSVSILIMLFSGVGKAATVMQIWLAPKIYLIEYAASLAK